MKHLIIVLGAVLFLVAPCEAKFVNIGSDSCWDTDFNASDCKEHALKGNPEAQARLGALYLIGRGVPKNKHKVFEWWTRAAEKDHVGAQDLLGSLYFEKKGDPNSDRMAAYWYLKSAEQGLAAGQYHLGLMYSLGRGVDRDYEKAAYWYDKAVMQGNSDAQVNLGVLYAWGEGVPRDYIVAYLLASLAMDSGDEYAVRFRNDLIKEMTPSQLEKAKDLTIKWKVAHNR